MIEIKSHDYTVKVTNRFNRLYLADTVHEELGTEVHDSVPETVIETIPKKRKCKKGKMLSEEALQMAEKEDELKTKEKRKETSI